MYQHEVPVLLVDSLSKIPTYGSEHASGLDLYTREDVVVSYGKITKIHTGVKLSLPKDCYGKIEDRSGNAVNYGTRTLAGVIDSDYTGEIIVGMTLIIPGEKIFKIGDRVAQLIIQKFEKITLSLNTTLDTTSRGENGFGSTGN